MRPYMGGKGNVVEKGQGWRPRSPFPKNCFGNNLSLSQTGAFGYQGVGPWFCREIFLKGNVR